MKATIIHFFFLIITLLFLNCNCLFAQKISSNRNVRNHCYLELLGNGIIYSFNYERLISDNFTIRGGLGVTPGFIIDEFFFGIPLTASYLLGGGSSKFEIGLGTTFFIIEDPETFSFSSNDKSYLVLTGILGYRFFRSRGGFAFRITFTPFYHPDLENSKIISSGGISFGYGF